MKKNTFVSNEKNITMGKGNLDLYKSTEVFRNRVQLYADGINAMSDTRLQYSQKITETTNYLNNVVLKERVVSDTTVAEIESKIESFRKAVKDITAEMYEKMPTYDETDKNLFYAYRQYILGEVEYKVYERAFMEWLDNGGIVPTEKGIKYIASQMGVKKTSNKALCKSGGTTFTTNMSEKQYLDIVYRTVATMMYKCNALKPYTYEYVIEDKKANKETK